MNSYPQKSFPVGIIPTRPNGKWQMASWNTENKNNGILEKMVDWSEENLGCCEFRM
jgi:hypothetical protein